MASAWGELPDVGEVGTELHPLSIADLLALEVPQRGWLLEGLLREADLWQLYGPRGLGKTWFGLSLAYGVASGQGALQWAAPGKRSVLYVDGEMALDDLRRRAAQVVEEAGIPDGGVPLYFVADGHEPGGVGDLSELPTRAKIDAVADDVGADLIMIDNLSSLFHTRDENAASEWTPLNRWILSHRRRGRSVGLVHHAGKGGQQRGTSRREDSLDLVLAMRAVGDDDEERPGLAFELHFEKHRSLCGSEVAPVSVTRGPSGWSWEPVKASRRRRVLDLHAAGLPQAKIAAEVGVSQGTVSKILARAAAGQ